MFSPDPAEARFLRSLANFAYGARKDRGLSHEALNAAGVNSAGLSRFERGKTGCSFLFILRLCRALGLKISVTGPAPGGGRWGVHWPPEGGA